MEKKEANDFCRRWLASWSSNNPNSLIRFYSENAFYQDPANPEGLKGHTEILPYLKKLLAANPNWKWEQVEIFPTDNGFVAKWKATILVGLKVITENGVDIVEIDAGKITRNEVYFDRTKWLEALHKAKCSD
jgi:hypothetical protein